MSTHRSIPLSPMADRPRSGPCLAGAFSLVELLVVIATFATLLSLLLPSLGSAREAGRSTVCLSNLRQAAIAVTSYAYDFRGVAPPGAANFLANRNRWHGSRAHAQQPFSPAAGPLAGYLASTASGTADMGVRTCPSFSATLRTLADAGAGFERGCGGYGYNNAFMGVVRRRSASNHNAWLLVTDRSGSALHRFRRPDSTLAFADAAFADPAPAGGLIEYSFLEPRFWPDSPGNRPDPSIHARHAGRNARANLAFLDGHAEPRPIAFTWSSGLYPQPAVDAQIGWPGADDNNGLFDYD